MIWNGNSVSKSQKEHSAAINALCIHESTLLTGSNDETIKIWEADSLKVLYTFDAKSKLEGSVCRKIRALDVIGKKILVGTFGS